MRQYDEEPKENIDAEWIRLRNIFEPYLNIDYMNNLFRTDREAWKTMSENLEDKFGIAYPLKKDAPKKAVDAYKQYAEMFRESKEGGGMGGPM